MRQRLNQIIPDILVPVPGAHLYETAVIHRRCCPREVSKRVAISRQLPWIAVFENSANQYQTDDDTEES